MMVHGAEQITPTEAGQARRNAWPDFVPVDMAERFLNENEQVDKVVNAELEPIQEEFKTNQLPSQRDLTINEEAEVEEEGSIEYDDGRLAW